MHSGACDIAERRPRAMVIREGTDEEEFEDGYSAPISHL